MEIKKLKHEGGFTMIEVMLVVVIMGILATMATFTYQDMVSNSRRSQVRAELASLYGNMKTFQAEWNQYFGDFNTIGYAPEGKLYYRVGFESSAKGAGPDNVANYIGRGVAASGAATAVSTIHSDNVCGTGSEPCEELTSNTCALTDVGVCVWNENDFLLCGCGNSQEGSTPIEDRWTLNEDKDWTRVSF